MITKESWAYAHKQLIHKKWKTDLAFCAIVTILCVIFH